MAYTQPTVSPGIREDLFPAQVFLPDPDSPLTAAPPTATNWVPHGATLLHRPARVVLTATHLYVFIDSPDGPALEIHGALDDVEGSRRQGYRVAIAPTEADPAPRYADLVITRYANCGCGSRLRSFRPFAHMRLLADSPAPDVSHR